MSSGGLDSAHPACACTLCPKAPPLVTLRTDCSQCRAGVSGPSAFARFVIAPLAVCPPWPPSGGFTLAPFSLPSLAGFIWSLCLCDAAGVQGPRAALSEVRAAAVLWSLERGALAGEGEGLGKCDLHTWELPAGAGDERRGDLGSPTTKGRLVSLQAGGSPGGLASWLSLGAGGPWEHVEQGSEQGGCRYRHQGGCIRGRERG